MIWFVLSLHIYNGTQQVSNQFSKLLKSLENKVGREWQTDNDKDYSPSGFTDRELIIFLCTIIYRASTTLYHDSYEVRGFIRKKRNDKVHDILSHSHWNCTGLLLILVGNVLYINSKNTKNTCRHRTLTHHLHPASIDTPRTPPPRKFFLDPHMIFIFVWLIIKLTPSFYMTV